MNNIENTRNQFDLQGNILKTLKSIFYSSSSIKDVPVMFVDESAQRLVLGYLETALGIIIPDDSETIATLFAENIGQDNILTFEALAERIAQVAIKNDSLEKAPIPASKDKGGVVKRLIEKFKNLSKDKSGT